MYGFLQGVCLAVMLAASPVRGSGLDVAVGDDLQAVYAVLGEPQGCILAGSLAVLTYERGRIELRDGKVVYVDLISAEAAVERKRLQEAARQAREVRRQAEGEARRDAKLEDPEFLALPATRQVAFWQSFRRLYPDVDLGEVGLPDLAGRAAAEREVAEAQALADAQARSEAELMDLRWRLMEAEARAHEAELAARRALTRRATVDYYGYGFTSSIWPRTMVIGGYPSPYPTPVCPPVAAPSPHTGHPPVMSVPPVPRALSDNPGYRVPMIGQGFTPRRTNR